MGIFRKGKNYYIDYYADGMRVRECVGFSKKAATALLHKRKTEIMEGKAGIKRKPKIKFSDFADDYLNFAKANKRSASRDYTSLVHLKAEFGNLILYQITPLHIENYKIKRKALVSGATINRELACLKHIFTKAIEWGKADKNPVKIVKMFKENNQRLRFLSKEEIQKLIDSAQDYFRPILIMAISTGMPILV